MSNDVKHLVKRMAALRKKLGSVESAEQHRRTSEKLTAIEQECEYGKSPEELGYK